jgi:hypothetical protein
MNQQTTIESLLERFNNAEKNMCISGEEYYRERLEMEHELSYLLNKEAESNLRNSKQKDVDLLQEFKDNFEWDANYQVMIEWEVEPSTACQYIKCDSLEEVKEYTSDGKQAKCPSFSDIQDNIEYGSELTGYSTTRAEISVENLRPKQAKITNKYMVNILLECDIDAESLEVHLNEILKESSVIKQAQVCAVTADA